MDGGRRAFQPQGAAQLRQGQVGSAGQPGAQPLAVAREDLRLAPGAVVLGPEVAPKPEALAEEFFDHARRDAEAFGDLRACAVAFVAGAQDALPQVEGQGVHGTTLPHRIAMRLQFYLICSSLYDAV